jgi:hypothetical protein
VVVTHLHGGVAGGDHAEVISGRPDEVHHVQVAHSPRIGLVGDLDLVPPQAEDVPDPERQPAEQVGLMREPVAVATAHMHDRLEALLERDGGRGPRRHPGTRPRIVAELDEVEYVPNLAQLPVQIGPVRRRQCAEADGQDPPVQDRFGDRAVRCLDSQANQVTGDPRYSRG